MGLGTDYEKSITEEEKEEGKRAKEYTASIKNGGRFIGEKMVKNARHEERQ